MISGRLPVFVAVLLLAGAIWIVPAVAECQLNACQQDHGPSPWELKLSNCCLTGNLVDDPPAPSQQWCPFTGGYCAWQSVSQTNQVTHSPDCVGTGCWKCGGVTDCPKVTQSVTKNWHKRVRADGTTMYEHYWTTNHQLRNCSCGMHGC